MLYSTKHLLSLSYFYRTVHVISLPCCLGKLWEGLRRARGVQSHCTAIPLLLGATAVCGCISIVGCVPCYRRGSQLSSCCWPVFFGLATVADVLGVLQMSVSSCWVLLVWGLRFVGADFRPFCCFWLGSLHRLFLGVERWGIACPCSGFWGGSRDFQLFHAGYTPCGVQRGSGQHHEGHTLVGPLSLVTKVTPRAACLSPSCWILQCVLAWVLRFVGYCRGRVQISYCFFKKCTYN
jgi:hypothetical protein